MAAGFRSPLPFLGLAAGAAAPVSAGVRSMLAPWMGGASIGMAPATTAGTRSMLAFWMGGAAAGAAQEDAAPAGTTVGRNGWDDWERIRRRDDANAAIAAWKESLAGSTKFDQIQPLANGGLPLANRGQRLPIGADASIDIDARIRAQQERHAKASAMDSDLPTGAVAGNSLLLAAMLALLEDDDT